MAAAKTLSDRTGLHKDNRDLAAEASTSSSDTRAVWTQKQRKDLHDVFHEEIDAGDGEIALQSVRTKLTNCKLLNIEYLPPLRHNSSLRSVTALLKAVPFPLTE